MVGVIRVDLETLGGNTGGDCGSRVSRNNIRRGVGDFRYSGGGRAAVFTVLCSSETTQIPTLMLNLIIYLSYMLNLTTQPDHMRQLQL